MKYFKYRAVRIEDSSYSIAAGLAFGCAISFTPAFGTHIIQSAIFCWIFRANWFAAVLGTVFGNPLTFPFLWFLSYQLGTFLFDLVGLHGFTEDLYFPDNMEEFWDLPVKNIVPIMVGGYIVGAISYPLFYYPFRGMIRAERKIRQSRMTKKVHKIAQDLTGQKD